MSESKIPDAIIETNFTYHPPHGDQARRYRELRELAKSLAYEIAEKCPPSRERSLAFTKLEESIFWANASIARNEPPPAESTPPPATDPQP